MGLLVYKKMVGFIQEELKKKQESENVTKIDFAEYHGVNHFAEWNPKLNSDEMNVLINWQSAGRHEID